MKITRVGNVFLSEVESDTEVDLFPFSLKKEDKQKPKLHSLLTDQSVNKIVVDYENLIDEIDNHLHFNDVDAISDCIDSHHEKMKDILEEIEYCKNNPTDLLYGFIPKRKGAPKFRKYAKNKRTIEKLRKA